MKLLYVFVALILGCNQGVQTKNRLGEHAEDSIFSGSDSCVNLLTLRKNNPISFELVKQDRGVDFGDSLLAFVHQNDGLKICYNNVTSRYNLIFNSTVITDSSWTKWASVFSIDITNIRCYYFLWKSNKYYMLINANGQSTGLAANYFQVFIYDVTINKVYDFNTMSDKPTALGVSDNGENLEFIRISLDEEYFHKQSSGTPLEVEVLEHSKDKWRLKSMRKTYCK